MKRLMRTLSILALAPAMAFAAAPQPRKAVDPAFFTGRWYEIARTDNARQKDCQAPTYQFSANRTPTTVAFGLTCRKGSPSGRAETLNVTIRMPTDAARNKFRVSALGGLLATDYWVLDIADDLSWVILATPEGENVWLLARRTTLPEATKTRLLTQIGQMGYDLNKIVQPRHS